MALQQILNCWDYKMDPNERHVMMAYADHANADGTGAWPSNELIAWKTGYSVRNVQKIRKGLVKKGLLVKVRDSTRYRPTEYRIDWSNAEKKVPLAEKRNETQGNEQGRKDFTPDKNRGEQSDTSGVNAQTGRGEQGDTSGVNASSPKPSVEPSFNRQGEPTRAREGENSEEDSTTDPVTIHQEYFGGVRLSLGQKEAIRMKVDDPELWDDVCEFWMLNDFRGRSVGRMLLKYAEDKSGQDGHDILTEKQKNDPDWTINEDGEKCFKGVPVTEFATPGD